MGDLRRTSGSTVWLMIGGGEGATQGGAAAMKKTSLGQLTRSGGAAPRLVTRIGERHAFAD
jgi:hypothetical protein